MDSSDELQDTATQLASGGMEKATFGGGCFWGVEALFQRTEGVIAIRVGYAGGALENPTYRQVCTGRTGHAEVVEIVYDPSVVTYDRLLRLFFENHNPTTLNRQGPDVGTQYRSVIFYHTPEQEQQARSSIAYHAPQFARPIVNEIMPATPFYAAEEYHQRYLAKRGLLHCHV